MLKFLKFLLFYIYINLVKLRIIMYKYKFYKTYKFNTKIISIGNLSFGGTGKTPLAISLANYLASNYDVALLLKGYKSKLGKKVKIIKVDGNDKNIDVSLIGDEASLALNKLKKVNLIISKDKTKGVKVFLQQNKTDYIIIDDGFSHLKLKKNLDVVLIDVNSFGNFNFYLREPYSSLKRANILIFTKANFIENKIKQKLIDKAKFYNKDLIIFFSEAILTFNDEPVNKEIIVLSAISNYNFFYQCLENCSYKIIHKIKYPDHYTYTKDDIVYFENIKKELNCTNIVCTLKDFVKLSKFSSNFIVADYEHKLDANFYKLVGSL